MKSIVPAQNNGLRHWSIYVTWFMQIYWMFDIRPNQVKGKNIPIPIEWVK